VFETAGGVDIERAGVKEHLQPAEVPERQSVVKGVEFITSRTELIGVIGDPSVPVNRSFSAV